LFASRLNNKLEGHPLSAVRDCLFIYSQPPSYIEAVSSTRDSMARFTVVTGIHITCFFHVSEYKLKGKGKVVPVLN